MASSKPINVKSNGNNHLGSFPTVSPPSSPVQPHMCLGHVQDRSSIVFGPLSCATLHSSDTAGNRSQKQAVAPPTYLWFVSGTFPKFNLARMPTVKNSIFLAILPILAGIFFQGATSAFASFAGLSI